MIKTQLESQFKKGKLYNSWIIESQDNFKALTELKSFISEYLLGLKIPLEVHPDFKFIEKPATGVGSKSIVVDQIRSLQTFFSKTSGISNNRVGVIFQADSMNPNAANSCLKILEDTPGNGYIFLITTNASNILPTILSRCSKLNITYENEAVNTESYKKFIGILQSDDLKLQLDFLKELSDKNREVWLDFSKIIKITIAKIIKKSVNVTVYLNDMEEKIASRFKSYSPQKLIEKFDEVSELIHDTINYDLDLKASTVLIINLFKN